MNGCKVTAAIPDDELAEHLRGFQGFVWEMSGGGEWTRSILDFIAEVRTVVGCRIDAPAGGAARLTRRGGFS